MVLIQIYICTDFNGHCTHFFGSERIYVNLNWNATQRYPIITIALPNEQWIGLLY